MKTKRKVDRARIGQKAVVESKQTQMLSKVNTNLFDPTQQEIRKRMSIRRPTNSNATHDKAEVIETFHVTSRKVLINLSIELAGEVKHGI